MTGHTGEISATTEDIAQHGGGQPAGEGIALAGVVTAEQVQLPMTEVVAQQHVGTMPKGRAGAGQRSPDNRAISGIGNAPVAEHDLLMRRLPLI